MLHGELILINLPFSARTTILQNSTKTGENLWKLQIAKVGQQNVDKGKNCTRINTLSFVLFKFLISLWILYILMSWSS